MSDGENFDFGPDNLKEKKVKLLMPEIVHKAIEYAHTVAFKEGFTRDNERNLNELIYTAVLRVLFDTSAIRSAIQESYAGFVKGRK